MKVVIPVRVADPTGVGDPAPPGTPPPARDFGEAHDPGRELWVRQVEAGRPADRPTAAPWSDARREPYGYD